ncbi:MAG: methyltransferase domain-containing protein [Syntrophaceae bacterium]
MAEQTFCWDAADYSRHSETQFSWARETIAKLNLKGDETLIDLGCGDGKVSAYIAERLPKGAVLGIDNSPEMIDLARLSFPAGAYPNLAFEHMDVCAIEVDRRFDIAFSNAVLHWVKDHRPVLACVRECLKPGGRLLFQMGGKGNAMDIALALLEIISRHPWQPYFTEIPIPYSFYEPEEYRDLLNGARLEPIRVELIPKDMVQPGRLALTGWIRSTWLPYTQRVPEDMRESFIGDLVDTYLAKHPLDEQGNAHATMMRLEVEAIKG